MGRIDGDVAASPTWFRTASERLSELVDQPVDSCGRDQLDVRTVESGLPDGFVSVDWRELAVDLNVRTPLTEREADVYVLHHQFGLDRTEIATTLSLSPNTVDNHLQRVRSIESEMTQLVVDTVESLGLVEDVAETITGVEYVGN